MPDLIKQAVVSRVKCAIRDYLPLLGLRTSPLHGLASSVWIDDEEPLEILLEVRPSEGGLSRHFKIKISETLR